MPTVGIRASLFKPPAIEIVPAAIILGASPARETPRLIELNNNGKGEIKVLSASSSDPAIKTNVLELAAGRKYRVLCQIPAGFKLMHGQQAEIKITTDNAANKEIVVPVTMARAPQPVLPPVNFTIAAQSLIGKKAPDVTIRSFLDRQVKVNDVTASVKVLDFWAMNCPQCMRQLPIVQRLFEQYRVKGVEFLLVNADRLAPLSEVVNRTIDLHLTMEMASDSDLAASVAYGAGSLPAMYIMLKSGQIEAVHIGIGQDEAAMKQFEKDVATELDLLLAGKARADFPTPSSAPADATSVNPVPAAMRNANAAPDRPVFVVSSIPLNLGKRAAGEKGTYDIYYRNGGGRPLEITKVSPSPGVTINPGYTKTVAPGEAGLVQVGFTTPAEPGPFNMTITIESNDPNRRSAAVMLSGQARPYIEIEPAGGADFARRRETHAQPCALRLTYTGAGPIKFISADSSSPKFEVELHQAGDAKIAELIVRAKPPFDAGENKGVIRVTTDCPQQKVVEVPVKLYMPSRIEVTPAEMQFLKDVWRAQKKTVTINNYGEKPLSILAVRRSQDKIVTQFFPDQDGMSYQLHVTLPADFVPAAGGDRVVIQTDDPEYKEIVVPLLFKSPAEIQKQVR
jgi:peroxiredoxin